MKFSGIVVASAAVLAFISSESPVLAQNPDYPGYLGVYVMEGNGGMRITNFIRNTPAAALARQGDIRTNDTIIKLGGRPTRTLSELRSARNLIPDGKEAKMILSSRGRTYHVWISRSEAVAAAYGAAGSAQPGAGAPMCSPPAAKAKETKATSAIKAATSPAPATVTSAISSR